MMPSAELPAITSTSQSGQSTALELARQAQQRDAERLGRIADIARSLRLLHQPGDGFEIRGIDIPSGRYKNTVAGWFDDIDKAAVAVYTLDSRGGEAVYQTINPCDPALLAKVNNRLEERQKETTSDKNIIRRRVLPIDIDATRGLTGVSGVPATEEELRAARELAADVEDLLRQEGFAHPLIADSGNGVYLLPLIDMPNDDDAKKLITAFLECLSILFPSRGGAHIDTGVFNASRILRVGGTWNRKGDGTTDRPHRLCVYHDPVAECPIEVVPVEVIRAFVGKYGLQSAAVASTTRSPGTNGNGHRLDLPRYLKARGVAFKAKPADGGSMYVVPCPFDPNHGGNGESAVYQADSGLLTYECKHNSCQGRKWEDYRNAIGKPDDDHYDPPLRSGNGKPAAPPTAAATTIIYRPVDVGTSVEARDRQPHNYGDVVADNGKSCAVHFRSEDGHERTVEIDKSHLFLRDGTPLASGGDKRQWKKSPSIGELVQQFPKLRKPIFHKLLRAGETMNIISAPKMGKSWLTILIALCLVTGRKLLGLFDVEPGTVLILDNELHGETSADRVPRVAEALGIAPSEYQDRLFVENLRGHLVDIYGLAGLLDLYKPGELSLVVVDAFYRFIPQGMDENSNSQMALLFNQLDAYALQLDCAFACVHHSSKGSQSGKAVTDVGAGAGSMARAVDTHLILRPHTEGDAVVLEAAARSWPPIEPHVLRWHWPIWELATDLDPTALKPEKQKPDKSARDREQIDDCRDAIQRALVGHPEHMDTLSKIKTRSGHKGKFFDLAIGELIREGKLCERKITRTNGQEYDGYEWSFGNSAT